MFGAWPLPPQPTTTLRHDPPHASRHQAQTWNGRYPTVVPGVNVSTQPSRSHASIKPLAAILLFLVTLFYSLPLIHKPSHSDSQLNLPSEAMSRKKAILYHTNWANYGRDFQVKDIPIEAVTDIAYAFWDLKESGNGQWVIASGDKYAYYICFNPDGPISKTRLLGRVFHRRIHGNHQNQNSVSLGNLINFTALRTVDLT